MFLGQKKSPHLSCNIPFKVLQKEVLQSDLKIMSKHFVQLVQISSQIDIVMVLEISFQISFASAPCYRNVSQVPIHF